MAQVALQCRQGAASIICRRDLLLNVWCRLYRVLYQGVVHQIVVIVVKVEQRRHRRQYVLGKGAGEGSDEVLEDLFNGLHFIIGDPQLAPEITLRTLDSRQ